MLLSLRLPASIALICFSPALLPAIRDGKSADQQKHLTGLAGSSQTFHVEFPITQ
jgi:hypothetical protein